MNKVGRLKFILFPIVIICLVASVIMLLHSVNGTHLVGCGVGSGCDNVMGSRWAYIGRHVGDLFRVQRIPKRMVECGSGLLQAIPRAKIVFGCKSLDDVTSGSWYIIPLPSVREVAIGYRSFWKFLSCEVFGANVCLLAVLSMFILTLLCRNWFVIACVSWGLLRGRLEESHDWKDLMRTPRGFHPPDPFCKSGGL